MNSLCIVYILYIFFSFCLEKTPKRTMMNWVTSGLFYAMSYFILTKQIKRQIILLDALLDFKYPSMCPTWNVMQLAAVSAQKFL